MTGGTCWIKYRLVRVRPETRVSLFAKWRYTETPVLLTDVGVLGVTVHTHLEDDTRPHHDPRKVRDSVPVCVE